jgi:cell division septum initiation protein DivIVA
MVKKGYDPDEVRAYLAETSKAVEAAQAHATQMEGRARQAVARAQELMAAQRSSESAAHHDDAETISRTLLLAQRTADTTVAEAKAEAEGTTRDARKEADRLIADARSAANTMIEEAKADARRAGEGERVRVESEVQQLLARLEFLRDDVAQLESFTAVSRDRLLETSANLRDVAERPVGGLGELRRPVLSAAADQPGATPLPLDVGPPVGNDLPPIRPASVHEQAPAPASTTSTPSHGTAQPKPSSSGPSSPSSPSSAAASDAKPESVAPSADLFGDDITAEVPAIGNEAPARPTMKFIDDELS